MHSLITSPFLGQYLLLRPGHPKGVAIPESRYEELRQSVAVGQPVPVWVHEATAAAWQMPLPAGSSQDVVLVRERSPYGYGKASWEINLGCDYDCDFCYLGEKRFEGLPWEDKVRLLTMLRDAGVLWLQITGGEALVDREFAAAYEYATGLGMMIQISTNGSQLHKPRIQELFAGLRPYRLTVSLYGASEETYNAVTRNRGAFARFVRGLDICRETSLPVRLNIIVADDNAHEVDDMVRLAEDR